MRKIIFILFLILFVGCATPFNINQIQRGMSQDEVSALKGKPISTEFDENTTSWLYKNLNSFSIITGPAIRYYWIVFDKDNKVIAVKDAGGVHYGSSSSDSSGSSNGMGFLCKDAISRGDQGAIFVHCK